MCAGESDDDGGGDVSGNGKMMLVFRGLILRHQLVMLLKNKVFFNEGDGVRGCVTALGGM